MIGLGARPMLEQGLAATGGVPDGALDRLYPDLLRYYDAHIAVHSRPFPGLTAALDRLDALGVRTAVATNKAEDMARKLLGELGLAGRLAAILGGATLGPGQRKPPPETARASGGERVGQYVYISGVAGTL